MDAQLEELKRLCAAATPGPWTSDCDIQNEGEYGSGEDCHSGFKSYGVYTSQKLICDTMNSDLIEVREESDDEGHYAWDETGRRNAEFIAAANPATVSDLITRLEKALVDAERYRWLKKHHYGDDPHATRIIAIGGGIDEAIDAARVQEKNHG